MAKKKQARSASSRANELKRAGARAAGARRTGAFYDQWRAAMIEIEKEIRDNGGVYPLNDGKLTLAELARRAGVVVNSLYPARHADFRLSIDDFIQRMVALTPASGSVEASPSPTWEELYKSTVANYQADALCWRSDRARREASDARVAELEMVVQRYEATIERLTHQLAALTKDRIVPIRKKP